MAVRQKIVIVNVIVIVYIEDSFNFLSGLVVFLTSDVSMPVRDRGIFC